MTDSQPPRPTDAELGILRVLWKRGSSTVRKIQADLADSVDVSATSVLKLLQIMSGKGLVRRDASSRAHLFEATLGERQTQKQLMDHLVDRAFDGSAVRLALRALSSRPSSREELAEIRELIERFREREGDEE
jgi:predicted transcriptional regulator